MVLIHFSRCINAISRSHLVQLGIYAFFPLCCYEGVITFPQNINLNKTNIVDQFIYNNGYKPYQEHSDDVCTFWNKVDKYEPDRVPYMYQLRKNARFLYEQAIIVNRNPNQQLLEKVLQYTKLPAPILQIWKENEPFFIKSKKGRSKNECVAPPGILPRTYKFLVSRM